MKSLTTDQKRILDILNHLYEKLSKKNNTYTCKNLRVKIKKDFGISEKLLNSAINSGILAKYSALTNKRISITRSGRQLFYFKWNSIKPHIGMVNALLNEYYRKYCNCNDEESEINNETVSENNLIEIIIPKITKNQISIDNLISLNIGFQIDDRKYFSLFVSGVGFITARCANNAIIIPQDHEKYINLKDLIKCMIHKNAHAYYFETNKELLEWLINEE